MTTLRRQPIAIRAYAAALHLCPPSFRRHYADQMLRDFVEARADARADLTPGARGRFVAQMSLDLARTIAVQWIRTGAILVVAAAMLCSLTLASALINVFQRLRFDMPAQLVDVEALFVVMAVAVVVVLIASTILFTQWFAASIRRRPRRRQIY